MRDRRREWESTVASESVSDSSVVAALTADEPSNVDVYDETF